MYKLKRVIRSSDDPFNPKMYMRLVELEIKRNESRSHFRYLYKSVLSLNSNREIALLEDIDEKLDILMKDIASVVKAKRALALKLDQLLKTQLRTIVELKEIQRNFKVISHY